MALRSQIRREGGGLGPTEAVEHGSHGGMFATVLSAVALIFSGLSYYETSLKAADLSVYVPPMIHYARDGADVFNIPITISNDGAQAGTVLSMTLDAENLDPKAERKKATFRSVFLGDFPRDENAVLRSFAPMSVPGHGTVTETVRFYNMGEQMPLLVIDKGDFRFTLTVETAKADSGLIERLTATEVKPLIFDLNLPYFAVRSGRQGTSAMYNKDWKPAVSENTDSAVSRKVPDTSSGGGERATEAAPEAAPDAEKK
jgi:hypothetical protein